ncbi:MAG: cupin domain-containing protein [Prochlorococcus marinus]
MSILVTSPCTETTIQELGIKNWPIWTCDVSSFDWTYEDQETFYFLSSWFRNFLLLSCLALEKKIFGGDVSMTLPESINKT